MSGALLETYIISEIAKSWLNAGKDPRSLFYYRDRNQKEIDLIISCADTLYPIEIRSTTHPKSEMAKNFDVLKNKDFIHIQTGTILCNINKRYILNDSLQALPFEFI